MARTNVFWYRHPEGYGNFGDELNPYIIQKLSGKQVVLGKPYHVESKINLLKKTKNSLKMNSVNVFGKKNAFLYCLWYFKN